MQGLIWSRPLANSQPSPMVRGRADAIAWSGGLGFYGTLTVRTPAIKSARKDDNLCAAANLAGAAPVEASGPTSDPDRATIAIASAASRAPAPRPTAGRRTTIW